MGRKDLKTIWLLVRSILNLGCSTSHMDYQSATTKNLFEYLASIGDFQTLATVYAVLLNPTNMSRPSKEILSFRPVMTSSLALAMHPQAITVQKRPSKLQASLLTVGSVPKRVLQHQQPNQSKRRVEPNYLPFIHLYANYLYALGFYQKRNQLVVLTNLSTETPSLQLTLNCSCNKVPCVCRSRCYFCRIPCKSLTAFCIMCKHGGHASCMKEWFLEERHCIAGCGCECIIYQ
jgi:hypothetical protein